VTKELKELYRHRDLLFAITYRDIKVRYKQSIMGFLWAVLMPVMIILSGVVVRYAYSLALGKQLNIQDIASVAVKSIPWAFVVSSIRFACNSLSSNYSLVTKIYFPKEIFPMASVLASLFDFSVASTALAVILLIMKIGWSTYLVWTPALVLTMVLLTTGIGLLVSAASLFLRDVKYIVEILLTFGIFFTPVFFDMRMLGAKGKWLLLNPLAPILDGLSACIVRHQSPALSWCAYSLGFAVATLLAGFVFFKHLEPAFAESI